MMLKSQVQIDLIHIVEISSSFQAHLLPKPSSKSKKKYAEFLSNPEIPKQFFSPHCMTISACHPSLELLLKSEILDKFNKLR